VTLSSVIRIASECSVTPAPVLVSCIVTCPCFGSSSSVMTGRPRRRGDVGGSGSGSSPMAGRGFSGVEPLFLLVVC
jgi:hypothetical protein